jgi:DNA-binding NtrC family response regulator
MNTAVPGASPRRILIVEDLEDSRQSLQELLQIGVLRVEVDAAEDGMRALELLAERPYALVITDLRMPKASGMSLLRAIKERNLPCAVVIVTGHGGVREAVEAMRLGADDFLIKPVNPQQLVMLVERLLRERGAPPAERAEAGTDDDVNLCEPATPNGRAAGS